MWGWGKRKLAHPLDRALFNWTPYDPFRVRDLLNGGCLILGRAGSGKTSSSGKTLMQAVGDNPQSAGLLVAAKPEDAQDAELVFAKARRLKDLLMFNADGGNRCNFLSYVKRPRDVVQFLSVMSEVMKRGDGKGGGDNSRFYEQQEERALYSAVSALQAAKEALTAANLHKFIMTAATTPDELTKPGEKIHSLSDGWPWAARLVPFVRTDGTAKLRIEPIIVFGLGLGCWWLERRWHMRPGLACFLIVAAVSMNAAEAMRQRIWRRRAQAILDARTEQEALMESYRGKWGNS
jgi:hypothetical protein